MRVRNVDSVASHHVSMRKLPKKSSPRRVWHKSLVADLADGWDLMAEGNNTNLATTNMTFLYNSEYIIPLKIGDQEFHVAVDTGSSDTWVIKNDFICIDPSIGGAINVCIHLSNCFLLLICHFFAF